MKVSDLLSKLTQSIDSGRINSTDEVKFRDSQGKLKTVDYYLTDTENKQIIFDEEWL